MACFAIPEMPASPLNHPTPAIAWTRWDELGGTLEAVVVGSAGIPGETRMQLQSVTNYRRRRERDAAAPWAGLERAMARARAAFTCARILFALHPTSRHLACSRSSLFTCAACSSTAAPPGAKPR